MFSRHARVQWRDVNACVAHSFVRRESCRNDPSQSETLVGLFLWCVCEFAASAITSDMQYSDDNANSIPSVKDTQRERV